VPRISRDGEFGCQDQARRAGDMLCGTVRHCVEDIECLKLKSESGVTVSNALERRYM